MLTLILLFFTLAFLEVMLSGDNAVVLASMANQLDDPNERRRALNIGIVGSYILRCVIIVSGVWLFGNPVFGSFAMVVGGAYLLWLFIDFFFLNNEDENEEVHTKDTKSYSQVVRDIILADVAFSLDSASTALGLSNNTIVILLGCLAGVIALRFLAGWFCKLIEEFTNLEAAGFIAVGLVGVQLFIKAFTDIEIPEIADIILVGTIFLWGFSKKNEEVA